MANVPGSSTAKGSAMSRSSFRCKARNALFAVSLLALIGAAPAAADYHSTAPPTQVASADAALADSASLPAVKPVLLNWEGQGSLFSAEELGALTASEVTTGIFVLPAALTVIT